MKIAILGGSFDPPHLGHLAVAQQVIQLLSIDQVWLMPCFSHAFDKRLSPAKQRLAMCKLLQTKNILVSDLEIQKTGISYSWETLNFLKQKFPQHVFSWIIGSDQITDFSKWYRWQDLIKENLIFFPRTGDKDQSKKQLLKLIGQDNFPENIIFLEQAQIINISSTLVRERISKKLKINDLVGEKIATYVKNITPKRSI